MTKTELLNEIKKNSSKIIILRHTALPLKPAPRVQKQINYLKHIIKQDEYILELKG